MGVKVLSYSNEIGDFSRVGGPEEVQKFNKWLKTLDFKYKIVISGNHEFTFDLEMEKTFKPSLK